MSSAPRRTLPTRPDLGQQKRLAKELLAAFRGGDPAAVARIRAELPDKRAITLADAQFTLAREYGFTSWPALKERIESLRVAALPPLEQFDRAVHTRDAVALRRVLQASAEARAVIDQPRFDFDAPALVAVAEDEALVEVLLEFGADPNRRSDWWAGGFHPLYSARGAAAERLLAAGAVPDACAAASLDRADLLARMLADDPARVHERGGDGQLPLHFARSRQVVDLLLDAGADIDARDRDHRSTAAEWMLGNAGDRSRVPLARYLVERGASADIFLAAALGLTERAEALLRADPGLLSLRTGRGDYAERPPASYHIYQWSIGAHISPLQAAARFGQAETLRALQAFASPGERLLLACNLGQREQAFAIVREHPRVLTELEPLQRPALAAEAWSANGPAVALLMELGFDPGEAGTGAAGGGTALHCAAWEGAVDCVESILSYPSGRALLEARDSGFGGTPLGWCCHGSLNCGRAGADHAGVARLLVAAGAEVRRGMECSEAVQEVLGAV